MNSATLSVPISAVPKDVFDFVSNPANMPRWAVNFCRGVRRDGDRWLVTTSDGEMETVVESNAEYGVVDFRWRPAPSVEAIAPSRVIPNGEATEYVFTLFQAPDMTIEQFQAGQDSLQEELNVLKRLLEESS